MREVKWLNHYSSAQSILIVGDGDLSFSLALAAAFGPGAVNIVATSLESYEALVGKYSKAESNVMELKRMGAKVLHGIDAKTMKHNTYLEIKRFDRIVFNFPHAGFNGKENAMHVISSHKVLVRGFLHSASHLIRPNGEIHVSHKTGDPYDKWDIEQLAFESSLIVVEKVGFLIKDYPGYKQKRGDGANCDKPFALGPCCTFKFCIIDSKKLKKMHGNWISSAPSIGGRAWPHPHFLPPVNTVQMPITLVPYSLGPAQMPQPGIPVNIGCRARAPYFPQHGTTHHGPFQMSLPGFGRQKNGYMSGITPQDQQWYQRTPTTEDFLQKRARLRMLIAMYGTQ